MSGIKWVCFNLTGFMDGVDRKVAPNQALQELTIGELLSMNGITPTTWDDFSIHIDNEDCMTIKYR